MSDMMKFLDSIINCLGIKLPAVEDTMQQDPDRVVATATLQVQRRVDDGRQWIATAWLSCRRHPITQEEQPRVIRVSADQVGGGSTGDQKAWINSVASLAIAGECTHLVYALHEDSEYRVGSLRKGEDGKLTAQTVRLQLWEDLWTDCEGGVDYPAEFGAGLLISGDADIRLLASRSCALRLMASHYQCDDEGSWGTLGVPDLWCDEIDRLAAEYGAKEKVWN